jgi:hypothetical protein
VFLGDQLVDAGDEILIRHNSRPYASQVGAAASPAHRSIKK